MLEAARLVEDGQRNFGRFTQTPLANPYDAKATLQRPYERFRTKEWVGFTLIHPEMASSMIIQDAKYLGTSEFYAFDRSSGQLFQYASNRVARPLRLPADLLHSTCAFVSSKFGLGYAFDDDKVLIVINIDATATAPAVKGRLLLDARHASPPLVVSAKMPGGSMYTNKLIYPASGVIVVGEQRYAFDPERDFAILDEHKSHLPYRTQWTWGTFAMPVAGGIAGANLAIRPHIDGQEEESCIWTPLAAEPLSDLTFTQVSPGDDMSDWLISSADERVDVKFTPDGHKDVHQNFVVAKIDYNQWFGHYDGTLRGANDTWTLEGVPGVCEHMDARL